MTKRQVRSLHRNNLVRLFAGLGVFGACTVVDKGDYTFTDDPDATGGEAGDGTGGTGGTAGTSGTSGDGGEATGGTGDTGGTGTTGGTGGSSGDAGDGGGGSGGDGSGVCDPNPCENGGDCSDSGGEPSCDCAPGYTGDTCGTEIDECDPNPCKMNVQCTDMLADFSCACPAEVTGKICELPRFQPIMMGPRSVARAVSADGTVVVGYFADPNGYDKPFMWKEADAASRPLPLPPTLRPDVHVTPSAVSGNGLHWAGEYRGTSSGDPPFPIGGTEEMARILLLPPNSIAGGAFDLNGDGTTAVGYFNDGAVRAVRWDIDGGPQPLMPPMMGAYVSASAITRDGRIIAGALKDSMNQVFIVYFAGQGVTPPGSRRQPMALNDLSVHGLSADGLTAVGTMWDTAFANFAFIARPNGSSFESIAPLTGTLAARSNVWDVSDDGQVLVGDMMGDPTTMAGQIALVWKADGTYRPLADILRDNRVDVASMGFQLTIAYGVSANGKVIVGAAMGPQGTQGFIARIP
jgi:uncharacterized membrane protein